MSKLFKLYGEDIAIDLGTSNVLLGTSKNKILINEPSLMPTMPRWHTISSPPPCRHHCCGCLSQRKSFRYFSHPYEENPCGVSFLPHFDCDLTTAQMGRMHPYRAEILLGNP